MKKVLFIMAVALMSTVVRAQSDGFTGSIDEYDLQGTWRVTGIEGYLLQLDKDPEFFSLSGNQAGRILKNGEDLFVNGWFISNNNKLHLVISNGAWLNFVIQEYSKDEGYMKLKSFDDHCVMSWSLQNYSSVPSLSVDNKKDSPRYSINGIRNDNPDGVYIQNGKKFIAK